MVGRLRRCLFHRPAAPNRVQDLNHRVDSEQGDLHKKPHRIRTKTLAKWRSMFASPGRADRNRSSSQCSSGERMGKEKRERDREIERKTRSKGWAGKRQENVRVCFDLYRQVVNITCSPGLAAVD